MKKMLAVCAACMVAGLASADVTSDNIVGFLSTDASDGFNWVAPMFTGVGADVINIQDIAIDGGGYGEAIQILDDIGATTATYQYWLADFDPDATQTKSYWGNEDCEVVDVTFSAGNGFLMDLASGMTVTIAGQVPAGTVSFDAIDGFNFSGNPFPATISIQAIAIDGGGYGEAIQILDDIGATAATYQYWLADFDPDATQTTSYWGNEDCEFVDFSLNPGAGFLMDLASGMTVSITAPYTL